MDLTGIKTVVNLTVVNAVFVVVMVVGVVVVNVVVLRWFITVAIGVILDVSS